MANAPTEFRIMEQMRVPALDPKRKGQDDVVVTYSVNGTKGYMVRLPAEGASETSIVGAIREEIRLRAALVGRTYTV